MTDFGSLLDSISDAPDLPSEWRIVEASALDRATAERLGNAFLLGNGYLGYRGTLEEVRARKSNWESSSLRRVRKGC